MVKSERKSERKAVSTKEKSMSTSNMSTPDERIDVRIPKNSKTYQLLYVDTNLIKMSGDTKPSNWRILDHFVEMALENREYFAEKIFEEFVARLSVYYPEKKEKLEKLRQLIIWQLLGGEELTDAYYEGLKKL